MKRVLLGAAALALACGGGSKDQSSGGAEGKSQPAGQQPAAGQATASAGGGTVEGKVTFAGTPPANPPIDMSEEPTCKQKHQGAVTDPVVVVTNGNLKNVFVYVKSGLPQGAKFEAKKETVELDQEGCLYTPRILGVMVNEPVDIKNSDPVLHNIKAVPKKNRGFNISQPQQGMETQRTFSVEEQAVPIECNVHGWMHGRIWVMSNPFFAVSDESGSFKITGLPAGTYTVEAWHEKLGTKTATVTVTENGTANAAFSFGS